MMTKLQAIRWFTSIICEERVVFTRAKFEGTNFGMVIGDKQPRLKLPKDLNCPYDIGDKLFRKSFTDRYPMTKGFSTITLTLLHECGHWYTRSVVNPLTYMKMVGQAITNEEYFNIPYERLATDWAICWLSNPLNRKIAKQFEENYFGYGKEVK